MGLVRGSHTRLLPCRGDQSLITMATAEDLQKKSEMNDQLREYISQWRDERSKEEAELKRLKDKQAARKEIRAEQEKKQAAQKRAEEEKIKREEQEKKEAEAQAKKLPKWFGVRPGKKAGDPETPEGEEEAAAEEAAEEEYEEEEEDYEEEEEEEEE